MSEKDTEAIREEEPGRNPGSGANDPSAAGELRCPLCGGQVTQRWRGVSTFVAVTFCISLFLTPVVFCACTAGAGPAFFIPFVVCGGIAVLSFWALAPPGPRKAWNSSVPLPRLTRDMRWATGDNDGVLPFNLESGG